MRGLIALVPAVIVACSSSNSGPAHVPAVHRATADACGASAPPSGGAPLPPDAGPIQSACTSDADCTLNGRAGRCIASADGGAKQCNYDACAADADCGSTGVCSCQGSTRGWAGRSYGNQCVPSNCRVDSDCGAGGFCSPTVSPDCGSFYGTVGWYCHTSQDECTQDSDCAAQRGYCAYRTEVGHWRCETGFCAG